MPPFEHIRDALLYLLLPALVVAAIVMLAVTQVGGTKQAAAGAALGLSAGAFVGLWMRDAAPVFSAEEPWAAFNAFRNALVLVRSESTWNRVPWAILAALCVGRLAFLADVHSSDGWLLRGGASIAIAWWIIKADAQAEFAWAAPALAAIIWANWVVLDRLASHPHSSSISLCVILTLLVSGAVQIHAANTGLMETSVALAAAFTGVALVASIAGVEFGGAIPAIAVAVPALLLMGNQESTVETIHWGAYLLPAVAPLVLVIPMPIANWPRLLLHLVRLILILAPLIVALLLAHDGSPMDFSEMEAKDF